MRALAKLVVFGGFIAALPVVAGGLPPAFLSVAGGLQPAGQVEVDRTLQRVHGTPIMASDVREARVLKLVPEAASGDEAVLTALENRLLLLREVSRATVAEPGRDAIAARRRSWADAWPSGTDLAAQMARVGTTDQVLDGWFRDDLRIAAYLDQRFGARADAARTSRITDWIVLLRRAANLPVKIALVTHEGVKE